ncbi:FkbM family methyltransferase [Rickettsiales endosymbiont of Stachyamoeba lipophora]|uniref:FkbM family methyltransferase n=1 Tax=Rickettsiales endosymbiont of Stachyamoeba lipophora TaxID=2486578 RepID=UPI000F652850|nr:FkbM family methyltransferase [Rickettsiales endosymbiont of Stachyamoeba lipophora]AZL15684.1 FkbM family methyltransferase [Rickettsiales endosymbiont of Stachyamoeba lipophora]
MFLSNQLNYLADNQLFIQSQVGQELLKTPLGFIDIGARGGAHDIMEPIAKITSVLGFEPDQEECERLNSIPEITQTWADFRLEPTALAGEQGESILRLLSAPTNHSLLRPNTAFTKRYNMVKWEEVGTWPLKTDTLDNVLYNTVHLNQHYGEFIKIDTQGTEYEIFQGATRCLNERTMAIICEVAFCELYKDQKLFSEIEIELRKAGFVFYGFMPIHGRSKKLLDKNHHISMERALYCDAIFFKDPLGGGYLTRELSFREIAVLFTCALLIGYYDFALELAQQTWLVSADDNEKKRIHKLVEILSFMPNDDNIRAVESLASAVRQNPERANVIVGNFVDRRRKFNDYDDILNISPLPKTI